MNDAIIMTLAILVFVTIIFPLLYILLLNPQLFEDYKSMLSKLLFHLVFGVMVPAILIYISSVIWRCYIE